MVDQRSTICAPVIADLRGLVVEPDEIEILKHPKLGGICLFARNYANPQQLTTLCEQIQIHATNRLLICVDQEGGRIQRFINGFSKLPSAQKLGQLFDQNASMALEATALAGSVMAGELLACGVDLSFAPVVDLNRNLNTVIGNRSFHRKPQSVSTLASTFMNGMHRAGMCAVVKHFPGHGNVSVDSHLEMPVDNRELDTILQSDAIPFTKLIDDGCDGVMTAHIKFATVDDLPPTFSSIWIRKILRHKLKFNGVVFSDDLSMGGANLGSTPLDRAQAAYQAGCDGLLVCNDQQAARQVLDGLTASPSTPLNILEPGLHHKPHSDFSPDKMPEWSVQLSKLLKE
jgi:beta-N-acetylhexosaminidase